MDDLELWKFIVGGVIGVSLGALLFLFIVLSGVI